MPETNAYNQLLFDIFVTALEGGIGYWSVCSYYHWAADKNTGAEDIQGFRADIHDIEDDGDFHEEVNREVIARGWRLATSEWRDRIAWSSGEKPPVVVTADYDGDWDYDAGDADVIVQLGLFGEVVYG